MNSQKHLQVLIAIFTLFAGINFSLAARPVKNAKCPDFTKGDQPDKFHDWALGPTGLRGWIYGRKGHTGDARQILVTAVAKNSPADGVLKKGDVILGVGGKPFDGDARIQFANAITAAERVSNGGVMELLRLRGGRTEKVKIKLAVMGTYSDTAPYNCPKSKKIFEQGCEVIAKRGLKRVSITNDLNALALLASGRKEYRPMLTEYAHKVADYKISSMQTWHYGYATLFLAEYVATSRDKSVMGGLRRLASEIARGASKVGTYGHGFAGPDGRCRGYGAMNQPAISLTLSIVAAREAGVKDPDVDRVIATSSGFLRYYVNKGAIPYGDHDPWPGHEDNGKCSSATVLFDLLGDSEAAGFYSKMATAGYLERERGHTGNFFNVLWAMPGVGRCGPLAAGAYMKEQGWYYDLARNWDGSFGYQGSPQGEEEHGKYTNWDCTGAYLLAYALPLKNLYVTGRKPFSVSALNQREVKEVIDAGRDYFSKTGKNGYTYEGRKADQLLAGLSSWSPAVRKRSGRALAECEGDFVPVLLKMLAGSDLYGRYGACEALGYMGQRANAAVPRLQTLLKDKGPWLQSLACTAIAGLGPEAYKAAVPDILRMAVRYSPNDPRRMAQRYAAKALFEKYKGSHTRITKENLLESTDRKLLYPAIRSILQNEDGRTRGLLGRLYGELPERDLKALLPEILKAVEEPAPSGIMFANGIRTAGLDVIAKFRIKEGLPLCLKVTEIEKWGKKGRVLSCLKSLRRYNPASVKTILPQLKQLEKDLLNHREARTVLKDSVKLIREIIEEAQTATGKPDFVSIRKFFIPGM